MDEVVLLAEKKHVQCSAREGPGVVEALGRVKGEVWDQIERQGEHAERQNQRSDEDDQQINRVAGYDRCDDRSDARSGFRTEVRRSLQHPAWQVLVVCHSGVAKFESFEVPGTPPVVDVIEIGRGAGGVAKGVAAVSERWFLTLVVVIAGRAVRIAEK